MQHVCTLFITERCCENTHPAQPTHLPIMSSVPPGLSGGNGDQKRRRLSFLEPSLNSSTPKEHSSSLHLRPPPGQIFGVNFHITQVLGIPASWPKQFRVVARCGNKRSSTSWKTSTKAELLIAETTSIIEDLKKSAEFTFIVESRNFLSKPTVIGKSKAFSVSRLEANQSASTPKPITLDLTQAEGSQIILLELNMRLLTSVGGPEVPDREAMTKPIFDLYTNMVSDAFKAWEGFNPSLSDPSRQIPFHVLKEMMHQIRKYMQGHPRGMMSFKIEDDVWAFLRATAERIEAYKAPSKGAARPREELSSLIHYMFQGFRLLHHLHRPQMRGRSESQTKYFEKELHAIVKPSPRSSRSQNATNLHELPSDISKLKGVDMLSPISHGGLDFPFNNIAFQHICRWMVDVDAEHQVFWLHGKFESGTARSPLVPALLEASKTLGFPAAYYSFSRGHTQATYHRKSCDMLNSLVYQLSLFDTSIATTFSDMTTHSNAPFESLDFFAQFQVLLHSLSKLSTSDEVKLFPMLLLIDDLEPMSGGEPSEDFSRLIQALYSASVATSVTTPVSSSSSLDRPLNYTPTPSSTYSGILRESLAFPPFLRIVVLSRSLGDKPCVIEKFAFIRDGHQLFGAYHGPKDKASRLYNSAINGSHKGKCSREEIPLDYSPLNTIAEANSQASYI